MLVVFVQDTGAGLTLQGVPRVEGSAEDPVGRGAGRKREGKSRFKIQDLLADERCSQVVLDILSTTDVGRLVLAEKDAGSEVSEWERRERRELEEERRGGRRRRSWVPRGGTAVVPAHTLPHGVRRQRGEGSLSFVLSFGISLVRDIHILLGQAWAEGKGELANCRPFYLATIFQGRSYTSSQ